MSKNLVLPHGLFTIIDDDDFERCVQFRWHLNDQGYVVRAMKKCDGNRTVQRLSRFIMNAPEGVNVDHIHGNLLDNRKSQLRFCTQQQNCCNRGKAKSNKSGFKGVSWLKLRSKWRAQIMINYKQIHIGLFDNIPDAVAAYAAASLKHHGKFGRT